MNIDMKKHNASPVVIHNNCVNGSSAYNESTY